MLVDRIKAFELDGRSSGHRPEPRLHPDHWSDYNEGLKTMVDLATKQASEPHSLSGTPLILEDGESVDWMPPPTYPAYAKFRDLELGFLFQIYSDQKQLLGAAHERARIDIFVANYSAVTRQDGSPVSYCVWSEGVDSLLPVTQKVAFMRDESGPVALGEWDKVFDIVGHLMEFADEHPAVIAFESFRIRQRWTRSAWASCRGLE